MQTHEIDFATLRSAYGIVRDFIYTQSYVQVQSLDDGIEKDMGLRGDDNLELLQEFAKKFELGHSGFEYEKHFHSEGELFGSDAMLYNILALSVRLPLQIIELLMFKKYTIPKPNFPITSYRIVVDLTFRDMITWYIEKDFKQRGEIRYQIKNV